MTSQFNTIPQDNGPLRAPAPAGGWKTPVATLLLALSSLGSIPLAAAQVPADSNTVKAWIAPRIGKFAPQAPQFEPTGKLHDSQYQSERDKMSQVFADKTPLAEETSRLKKHDAAAPRAQDWEAILKELATLSNKQTALAELTRAAFTVIKYDNNRAADSILVKTAPPLETLRRGTGICDDITALIVKSAPAIGIDASAISYLNFKVELPGNKLDGHMVAEFHLPQGHFIADGTNGHILSSDEYVPHMEKANKADGVKLILDMATSADGKQVKTYPVASQPQAPAKSPDPVLTEADKATISRIDQLAAHAASLPRTEWQKLKRSPAGLSTTGGA